MFVVFIMKSLPVNNTLVTVIYRICSSLTYCYNNACKVKPDQVTHNAYVFMSYDRNSKMHAASKMNMSNEMSCYIYY